MEICEEFDLKYEVKDEISQRKSQKHLKHSVGREHQRAEMKAHIDVNYEEGECTQKKIIVRYVVDLIIR